MNLTSCGDANGCLERLIARLHFEDYLRGLGEVPASWPMEAMRAQAVAARTYAAYDVKHYGRRADCNCDITDGAGDQTYVGWNREGGADGDRWVAAVTSTAGEVITYQGALIQAFYAASDGGHSDSVEDVWHGGNPAYAIPWLTGVCDPGESTGANPWTDWTKTYSATDVTARLAPYTGSIGTIRRFDAIRRGEGGRIITAVAVGGSGSATVTGTEMKSALGWYDERVWINSDRTIRGSIRETYDRLGCRPGLPTSPQRAVTGGSQQFFASGGPVCQPRLGAHRVVARRDRSRVPGRRRCSGCVGGADERALDPHPSLERLRRMQADHVRRGPDLLRARHGCARALGQRARCLPQPRRRRRRARSADDTGPRPRRRWRAGRIPARAHRLRRRHLHRHAGAD